MQIQTSEAVKLAKEFFLSIHPGAQNVMAEEILLTDDDNYWMVTLATQISPQSLNRQRQSAQANQDKTDTGEVRGMSIRKL